MKCYFLLLFSGVLFAAPILRLPTSVITAQASIGATPPTQTLQATNVGDGTLSLSVSVSPAVPWLTVSVGASNLIQFTYNSAALAAGNYTARVNVSDPNAVDSPQVLIVMLQIGVSASPIDQWVAPGSTTDLPAPSSLGFCFSVCPAAVTTTDGGGWLSVVIGSEATLQFYKSIRLAPPPSMATGTYTGSATIGTSAKVTIPVTMRVTQLPIAVPSTNKISLRLTQNGPATTYPFLPYISFSNSGAGTLQVTGISGSGSGVSAYNYQGLAIVTVDPGSLAPGIYNDGVVTVQCNGANCPLQVPVSLEIIPQAPPTITYQGVLDNAAYRPTGSPGDVMIVKGEQLSLQTAQTAPGVPLPTTLGGASVLVNGVATPLYYSSFGQMAFQVRAGTFLGTALVQVIRDGVAGNTVSVGMTQQAPEIVVVTDTAYNIVDETHPAKAGSTLIFWTIGLGATNPVVADGAGAPANPLAQTTAQVSVVFGLAFFESTVTPSFAGLSPGSVGLYQVAAAIPASTPKGTVQVSLQMAGAASNFVTIAVQ